MKLILYLISLTLPLALWGQDSTLTYPKNQLKFNTFKVLDLYNPGFELGYERRINNYISVHIAGAKLTDLIIKPYDKYDGYRLTCELKYINKMHFEDVFVIPSFSFVQNKMEMTAVGVFARDTVKNWSKWTAETYSDTFSIQKTTWALNANASVLLPYHSFAVEYILGLGIKNRSVTHTDRLYPNDPFRPNRHNGEADAYLRAGAYYTFSMVMTLRVAYCF
ncbi:MAG: hypothetical protein KF744_13620 [Taibaiella sp.]|nr:hypothetical protein [Taibaiella sp.]